MRWVFPQVSGKGYGFKDAGVNIFASSRAVGVFRECVQNSLDAKDSTRDEAVLVELSVVDLDADSIDAEGLSETLGRCQRSRWNSADSFTQFEAARSLLRQATVPALKISDLNTVGTSDVAEDGSVSKWEGLTKSSGHSVHSGGLSLGSFGLGKHAAFAVTPLRTVLYSTCFSQQAAGGGVKATVL